MPPSPFSSLMAAVQHLEPTYPWHELDILTARSSLRNLLRWIDNKADRDFRIDIELVGEKTVILSRFLEGVEINATEHRGFGHNFETAYTTSKLFESKKELGHHRIVEYVRAFSYAYGGGN